MQQTQKQTPNTFDSSRIAPRIHIDPIREAHFNLLRAQQNYQSLLQGAPASLQGLVTSHGMAAPIYPAAAWPLSMGPSAWPGFSGSPGFGLAVPSCDLFDEGTEYVCQVDLPGIRASGIELDCSENVLLVTARRTWETDESAPVAATQYPTHQRAIPLPTAIKTDAVNAVLRDGVLTVRLTKSQPTKAARRIEIQG